jgi:hypothetical protein
LEIFGLVLLNDFNTLNWLRGQDLNLRPSGYELIFSEKFASFQNHSKNLNSQIISKAYQPLFSSVPFGLFRYFLDACRTNVGQTYCHIFPSITGEFQILLFPRRTSPLKEMLGRNPRRSIFIEICLPKHYTEPLG